MERMRAPTLVLLRHAKSDWSHDAADIDRRLSGRGRRQAPEAGRWLAASVHRIDLAVVSPAARARCTWDLVAAELDPAPRTRVDDRVYAASGGELLAVVRDLPASVSTVVVVGHNPGMQELVSLLTGRWEPMPTSALAVVSLPGPWSSAGDDAATLVASGRPPADPGAGV